MKRIDKMEYKRYRWFFTSSGKLVFGGKSALQNEEIVASLLKSKVNRTVMHTRVPGSPFAIIDSPIEKVNELDLEETAVWCACFFLAAPELGGNFYYLFLLLLSFQNILFLSASGSRLL